MFRLLSCSYMCYPVKTKKRKSHQSKWSCFKSNTSCTNTISKPSQASHGGHHPCSYRCPSQWLHKCDQQSCVTWPALMPNRDKDLLWQSLCVRTWGHREFQEVQHLGKSVRPDEGCQLRPQPRGSLPQALPGTASPVFEVLVEGQLKEAIRDKA